MKHHAALGAVAILAAATVQVQLHAQIHIPSVGFVRGTSGLVQSVYGIPGNLLVAPSRLGNAKALSFSTTCGLIANSSEIKLLAVDGSVLGAFESAGSTPLVNVQDGATSAIVWLPASHLLRWWTGKSFAQTTVTDPSLETGVTSVQLSGPQTARFLVTEEGGQVAALSVSLETGSTISSDIHPGVQAPAFEFGPNVIWGDGEGLHVEGPNGIRHDLPSPKGPIGAERMSANWVHITVPSGDGQWALHLGSTEPSIWQLPAPKTISISSKILIEGEGK